MLRKIAILLIVALVMMPFYAFADGEIVESNNDEVVIVSVEDNGTSSDTEVTEEVEVVNDDTQLAESGITPDSFIYGLDKLAENIKIVITFDSVEKAKLFLELAEERLAESKDMMDVDKLELAEQAINDYKEALNKATATADTALEDGEEVSEVTKEIQETTMTREEIVENILDQLTEEIKERVSEELKEVYDNIQVTNDVVTVVEGEEVDSSLEEEISKVVIDDTIEDENLLETLLTAKLNTRQIIALISLTEQSGKTLEEVVEVFTTNDRGIGSTAMALGLAPKNALKGINKTFKEYKKSVDKLLEETIAGMTIEEIEELEDIIVNDLEENEVEVEDVEEVEEETEEVEVEEVSNETLDRLEEIMEIAKGILSEKKGQYESSDKNDKVVKEIDKAEKKIDKTLKKVDEKIKKANSEGQKASDKVKEVKDNNKKDSNNGSKGKGPKK